LKEKSLSSLFLKTLKPFFLAAKEEGEVFIHPSSPFPLAPLLPFPFLFLASSEAPPTSLEVLFIAHDNLFWFNISFDCSFTADDSISASLRCSQLQIRHLLEILGFDFFLKSNMSTSRSFITTCAIPL
jgi:hypothetical protein